MNNFDYYAPTKVVFGKDTEKETGRLVKEQGASSVLVHFGGKSAIASGLLDRVCQSLKEEGIAYETLGGVVPPCGRFIWMVRNSSAQGVTSLEEKVSLPFTMVLTTYLSLGFPELSVRLVASPVDKDLNSLPFL